MTEPYGPWPMRDRRRRDADRAGARDDPPPRPRTAAEITAAADQLGVEAGQTASALPPLSTTEVLSYLAAQIHASALDLWILRDSVEAQEPNPEHALAELPRLATHLDAASRSVRVIADMLGRPLPVEPDDFDGC